MAFRRQDIPKTTRKGKEGEPRRLYPRFAKDKALLPKIELAIAYLDGMVGRRRGELAPDTVLELFGDPKLARCFLACLADAYRYRTPTFAEVVGDDAATALAAWDVLTAVDLRGHVYRAANARWGGFVAGDDRAAFLAEVAAPLGLEPAQLEELIHLDAERNALLIRVGPRPAAADVLARYNVTLALSVLRHASTVTLELPGLDATAIETVCARNGVGWRRLGPESVRLAGRQSALGSWVQFGARVARCALHLMMLAPREPSGQATVHLNGSPLAFVLDGFVVGVLRPRQRAAASAGGVVRAAVLADEVTALRRKASRGDSPVGGWAMRRALEPIVGGEAVVLPELVFTRGSLAVGLVPVERRGEAGLAALTAAGSARPLIALRESGAAIDQAQPAAGTLAETHAQPADGEVDHVPFLRQSDATALLPLLEAIARKHGESPTPLGRVEDEVVSVGWVESARLAEVLGDGGDVASRLRPLTSEGDAVYIDGFGLCRVALLDEMLDEVTAGPLNVAAARAAVSARVGAGPGADALTLHLLSRHAVVASPPLPEAREDAA